MYVKQEEIWEGGGDHLMGTYGGGGGNKCFKIRSWLNLYFVIIFLF